MVELIEYSSFEDYKLGINGEVSEIIDRPASHLVKDVRKMIRKVRGKYYVAFVIKKDGEVVYKLPMR